MLFMASPDQPLRPPELTLRSILTGLVIGAALTPCNVYAGLKIGWAFNMAIAAGLIGYGLWRSLQQLIPSRDWGLLENNINQMIASSAASIISGGLVAPVPALTLLTGQTLVWYWLMLWVFTVSALGVVVAVGLRQQLLIREQLAFPAGIATAETMMRIHAQGGEAASRLRVLLAAAGISGALKLVNDLIVTLPRLAPSWKLGGTAGAPTFANLGFAFDPSLLLLGFGAIIGLRAGISILIGTIIGWGFLAGFVLEQGWAEAGEADAAWFEPLVTWLLWPGATLMVVSSLTSFGLAIAGLQRKKPLAAERAPLRGQAVALAAATALVVAAAMLFFDIAFWQALLAVVLSYVLAIVAARVTGEAGITPIGAMGQITQFAYGIVSPGNLTANLMTANITGGAAGQCADLMQDLKTGLIINANLRFQVLAQIFGVGLGSLVGVAVYLTLIPDPAGMLMTEDWPAPAVATWKAVAEVMTAGIASLPPGALAAMTVAAAFGLLLALLERMAPPRLARFLPSAPAIGLAFVIPAWNGLSLFFGAAVAALLAWLAPGWSDRHRFGLAAGLVAGESLVGVATVAAKLLG